MIACFEQVYHGKVNVCMGGLALNAERAMYMQQLFPHYYTSYVFAGVLGRPYTAFEKLYIPFSTGTWIGIGLQLFLSSLVVVILKLSKLIDFRTKADMVIFNMITSFLGYAIIETSKRSVYRFLLVVWMLTAIILRNSYQGVMFKILQQNGGRPPPSRIDQLIADNYTIRAVSSSVPAFKGYEKLQKL